jgi:hypothetical protein
MKLVVGANPQYNENLEILGENEIDKFISLPNILDKLDYLAFYVFNYFSNNDELNKLLKKADFIVQLKVSNSYYLLSHGGITEDMFDTISSNDIPISLSKINDFINKYKLILSDSSKIKKLDNNKVFVTHNATKKEQSNYYNDLIKTQDCKTDNNEIEIEFKAFDDLNTSVTDSYNYNLLLLNSLNRNISKINEQLKPPPQQGGFVGQATAKWAGLKNDVKNFNNETRKEIIKYNVYLKEVVKTLLQDGGCVEDNKPTINLLLILMLAHSFNSNIFKGILNNPKDLKTEKIKSKNYSVLINTIYDHRAKHNVPFKNVHQIIANSNNTAQTTEVIYDAIFFGTVIDCYETKLTLHGNYERNYVISIDNTAIIKHYSYFDSNTFLFIEPNIKDIFNTNQMGIETKIQKKDTIFIIFCTLENIYKVLNHKIKEQKLTIGQKIKKSTTTSTNFGNLICPSMNYYGINKDNEIIFSKSEIVPIDFRSYKF